MIKPLVIGFVIDDSIDDQNGVQNYVRTLAFEYQKLGHIVHFITSTSTGAGLNNVHVVAKNISVRFNGNRLKIPMLASKSKIKMLMNQVQFDVLHVQSPHSPLLAGRVIKAADASTRIVSTLHILPLSKLHDYATRLLFFATKRSRKRIDYFMSVSTAAKDYFELKCKIRSEVVPNCVIIPKIASIKKQNIISYVGRFVERKDPVTLIKAFFMLPIEQQKQFSLVLAGSGDQLQKCRNYALNAQDPSDKSKVEFLGYISDELKFSLLSRSKISAFPSIGGESFGIVLIEAMACESVVLGASNPGYSSVLRPEQLFDPYDAQRLSYIINKLRTDKKFYDECLAWQKSQINKYNSVVVASKIIDIYRS